MLSNTIQRLCEPWLLTESLHQAICTSVERLMEESPLQLDVQLETTAQKNIRQDSDEMAVITLSGTMMRNPNILERVFMGGTDTEDFTQAVKEVTNDSGVKGIILNIDSGGGSIAGVPEAAEAVREAVKKKPVISYSSGQMGSAAFWVASQANASLASPSARIGSIGVYLPFLDASEAFKQDGLKMDVITNKEGTFKGSGLHGTELTEPQRDQLQAEVQEIFEMFKQDVQQARGGIEAGDMRGQSFMAGKAKKANLIDAVGDFGDAVSLLLAEVKRYEEQKTS